MDVIKLKQHLVAGDSNSWPVRLSQLINKSNQFNLTTRRRSEAEVLAVMNDPAWVGYSMRLKARSGDHGLISIVIGQVVDVTMKVDAWLMSPNP